MKPPLIYHWILSGCLFGICFVIPFLWWCFLPALVLFLHLIKSESSLKRIFYFGWIVGTIHYAGAFFWVWSTFPIQWMADVHALIQFGAIGYYWVATSTAVGLGGAIVGIAIKKLGKTSWMLVACMPFLWVLSEVLKSVLFSVYTFGDGAFLNAGFSYGYLGYLLAENPLTLKLASVAGVYGLSYVAALLGVLFYLSISRRLYMRRKYAFGVLVLAVFCVAALSILPVSKNAGSGKEVVSLEAHFSRDFLAQEGSDVLKNNEVREAVSIALKGGAEVVVTPEDVRWSEGFETKQELFAWVREQTDLEEVVIVDTGPAQDARGEDVIRAYMYDLSTESIYFFDKKYLVPQGEFLSYIHEATLSLLMSKERTKEVLDFAHFKAGVLGDSNLLPRHLPGILFCFETMVPYGVRKAARYRDPDLIVHPISHAWFSDPLSFSLEYQLDGMLKVHAVWNNTPIVTSGSMTQSRMYLPSGDSEDGEIIHATEHTILKKFSL